jgi:hypothetical protein
MIEITEGKQVGTLYHFATLNGLLMILESNSFKAYNNLRRIKNKGKGSSNDFVSFTRDKNFLKVGRLINNKLDVRIVIDGNKLSDNYVVSPFNFYSYYKSSDKRINPKYDETEERVRWEVDNARKYILSIDLIDLSEIDTDSDNYNSYYAGNFGEVIPAQYWNRPGSIKDRYIQYVKSFGLPVRIVQ